jgi:hypothetical protein
MEHKCPFGLIGIPVICNSRAIFPSLWRRHDNRMRAMPISLARQRFSAWNIAGAVAHAGVYVLWQGDEVVYVGRALASLRERLMEHYTRQAKPWDVTHFGVLACALPAERESELLRAVRRAIGRLPRYNASA